MMKQKQIAPFERNEHLEALLQERATNKVRYEAAHRYNEKRQAENYERERARHERQRVA